MKSLARITTEGSKAAYRCLITDKTGLSAVSNEGRKTELKYQAEVRWDSMHFSISAQR